MHSFSLPLALLLSLLAACPAYAQITEDFSAGHGLAPGGDYTGEAAGGWTTPWLVKRTSTSVTVDRDVVDTQPLVKGGGNYLTVSGESTSPGIWGIARQFASYPNREYNWVRRDRSHVLRFQFRVDELAGWSRGEEITIGDSLASNENNGLGAATSFFIRAYHSDTGAARAGQWAFYNGLRDGSFNSSRFIDTGIPLTPGVTYQITFRLRPSSRSWLASIEDGTRRFDSELLGYRSGGLGTGVFTVIRTTNDSSDFTVFSLDNLFIDDGD